MTEPKRTHRAGGPHKRQGRVLSCSLVLAFAAAGTEVHPISQYSSRAWQTDAGLPNRTAQAVLQTRDGFLWVGMQHGLARFDGIDFTVFSPDNVKEMENANILGLYETRDGRLWFATSKGVCVIDPATGPQSRFPQETT